MTSARPLQASNDIRIARSARVITTACTIVCAQKDSRPAALSIMRRTLARLPAGREQEIRLSVAQAASEVSELISQAERALASGDRARADALLLRVKAIDPGHPAILNAAALHELRSGNAVAAREMLERALARDGANTRRLMNLAGALRRLGLADD